MGQCKAAFRPTACRRCVVYCLNDAGHEGCHELDSSPCLDDDCPTERSARKQAKPARAPKAKSPRRTSTGAGRREEGR